MKRARGGGGTEIKTVAQLRAAKASDALIFYHMEGCGHCIVFKPEWERLKRDMSKHNLHEVNSASREVMLEDRVNGFPTLIYWKDNKRYENTTRPYTYESVRKFVDAVEKGKISPRGLAPSKQPLVPHNQPRSLLAF